MSRFRVPVSNVIAGLDGPEWKRYWRKAVAEAGREAVSTDDEIAQEYTDGRYFLVGEVR